ncbi:MAG: hypothetical protein AAFY73_13200 [Pseudomonadota bacterium]
MAEEIEDHTDLDDGRELGDFKSRYGPQAWFQIVPEFLLLAVYLSVPGYFLLESIIEPPNDLGKEGFVYSRLLGVYVTADNAKWIALALAGFIGGAVFDLKWLYHSVAKGKWNRDRCLWRVIVPFNSAAVSTFTGFLFASGIIPFLKDESFENVFALLGFGFIFGYFSDNILASMQNLAQRVFGTLNDE